MGRRSRLSKPPYDLYQDTLDRLKAAGLVYPCYCSRKDWQAAATHGADGFVYNGRCRNPQQRPDMQNKTPAWRIQVPDRVIGFSDGIVGHYAQNLAHDIGDFVLLRADGYWAYQLAVVADDADQGITHIVRGQDLLVSTPRQIYLQQCLGIPTSGLRAPSPVDQQPRAKMVETNPCPGFGFESKRTTSPPSPNLPQPTRCTYREPSARIARLGGGALANGQNPKIVHYHGLN